MPLILVSKDKRSLVSTEAFSITNTIDHES